MSNEESPSEYQVASMYEDDGEDDEADFDPGDIYLFGDDDDDEDEDDSSNDDDEEEDEGDCVILNGKLHLNEEGRLIYSGTWCRKSEFHAEGGGGFAKFKLKSQEVFHSKSALEKTAKSFNVQENGGFSSKKSPPLLFDFRRPTLSKLDGDENGFTPLPSRRTILFDGFFIENSSPSPDDARDDRKETDAGEAAIPGNGEHKSSSKGKKMKERDVEIIFQLLDNGNDDDNGDIHRRRRPGDDAISVSYKVTGRGYNAYGPFILDGGYDATGRPGTLATALVLHKMYGFGGNAKSKDDGSDDNFFANLKRLMSERVNRNDDGDCEEKSAEVRHAARGSKRRRKRESDDEDEDDEDWAEEKADYSELIELTEDANLTVEELRKKYYGGGSVNEENKGEDGGDGKLPAKKAKWEESDDSECGF